MSNSRYRRGTVGTLAALGSLQSDAAPILTEIVQVTAADGTKGIRLPAPEPGGPPRIIVNTVSAQDLKIWPAVGGIIDYGVVNTAFTLGGRKSITLYPYSATQWYTVADTPGLSLVELAYLDGVTAGTGLASKALVLDANGDVTMPDLGSIGFGGVAKVSWDPTDANANEMLIQLPAGGAVDVPVIVIGQGIEAVDLGLYNGVTEPRMAMFGSGAVATGPVFEFRKARGTVAAPTVVTSADDLGSLNFHGCVAAGEYVQAAQILVEMTGTVATTRGPGVITFKTATDAAPSVLTTAMTIGANQIVTFAAGATLTGTAPLTLGAGGNMVLDTGTGTKIGTAVTQKLGFWNAAPVVQPAGANQAALAAYGAGANGLDSAANMSALHALVVAMRLALVDAGLIKGAA